MTQYISWKQQKVMGKRIRLYLSMSEAVMPNMVLMSLGERRAMGGGGGGALGSDSTRLWFACVLKRNTFYEERQ